MKAALSSLMKFATQYKQKLAHKTMSPSILIEGEDGPMAIAIAPSSDKGTVHKGLLLARLGFPCAGLNVCYDAVVKNVSGDSPFSQYDVESGSIHCLIAFRIAKSGEMSSVTLPYIMDEGQLQWLEEGITEQEDSDDFKIQGRIADNLRKIMKETPLSDQAEYIGELLDSAVKNQNLTPDEMPPERIGFHVSRAVIAILMENKFKVMDNFSRNHIEWTGAKEKCHAVIDTMIEDKVINDSHKKQLHDCVDKYIGSPTFKEKFEHYVSISGYESAQPIFEFSELVYTLCLSPAEPDVERLFLK